MNPPTICPDEQESTVSIEPTKPRRGRRPLFGQSMPQWVMIRRWRERKTGFSDPLLVQMGLSALPDAPPKPSKPPKPPMPQWVMNRRWRERKTGFSDPLLVQMGMSALPDAPPKPSKPPKTPKPVGRPALFGRSIPGWVRWRRHRELQTGFSDPLLVQMGMSALPDAPPKPPKPSKPPKPLQQPPEPPEPPKPLQQPPEPPKPPETGSAAWAASLSWGAPVSGVAF